jgi:hypothetical protein
VQQGEKSSWLQPVMGRAKDINNLKYSVIRIMANLLLLPLATLRSGLCDVLVLESILISTPPRAEQDGSMFWNSAVPPVPKHAPWPSPWPSRPVSPCRHCGSKSVLIELSTDAHTVIISSACMYMVHQAVSMGAPCIENGSYCNTVCTSHLLRTSLWYRK